MKLSQLHPAITCFVLSIFWLSINANAQGLMISAIPTHSGKYHVFCVKKYGRVHHGIKVTCFTKTSLVPCSLVEAICLSSQRKGHCVKSQLFDLDIAQPPWFIIFLDVRKYKKDAVTLDSLRRWNTATMQCFMLESLDKPRCPGC